MARLGNRADADLIAYTRRAISLRHAHPVLRRGRYLADPGYAVSHTRQAARMTAADCQSPGRHSVTAFVDGTVAPDMSAHGQPMLDADVLIMFNGSRQPVTFTVPEVGKRSSWRAELNSFDPVPDPGDAARPGGRRPKRSAAASGHPPGADQATGDIRAGSRLTVMPVSLILLVARQLA